MTNSEHNGFKIVKLLGHAKPQLNQEIAVVEAKREHPLEPTGVEHVAIITISNNRTNIEFTIPIESWIKLCRDGIKSNPLKYTGPKNRRRGKCMTA